MRHKREIKFRVWDTEKNTWYKKPQSVLDWTYNDLTPYGDSLVWMQFTGLKDKNGKEIFEGDLLKFSIEGDMQAKPMEVKIPDFFIELGHDDHYYRPDADSFEVIGNIWEDPELLK